MVDVGKGKPLGYSRTDQPVHYTLRLYKLLIFSLLAILGRDAIFHYHITNKSVMFPLPAAIAGK